MLHGTIHDVPSSRVMVIAIALQRYHAVIRIKSSWKCSAEAGNYTLAANIAVVRDPHSHVACSLHKGPTVAVHSISE